MSIDDFSPGDDPTPGCRECGATDPNHPRHDCATCEIERERLETVMTLVFPEGLLEAIGTFWLKSCSAAMGNPAYARPPLGWPPWTTLLAQDERALRAAALRAVDMLIAQDRREP